MESTSYYQPQYQFSNARQQVANPTDSGNKEAAGVVNGSVSLVIELGTVGVTADLKEEACAIMDTMFMEGCEVVSGAVPVCKGGYGFFLEFQFVDPGHVQGPAVIPCEPLLPVVAALASKLPSISSPDLFRPAGQMSPICAPLEVKHQVCSAVDSMNQYLPSGMITFRVIHYVLDYGASTSQAKCPVPLRLHSGWSPVTKGRRMNYLLGEAINGWQRMASGIILHPRKPGLVNIDPPAGWWIGCGIGFSSAIGLMLSAQAAMWNVFVSAVVEVFSLVVRDAVVYAVAG
ncbi:hypothetical protein Nepgr_027235 [Nepenthes gracilis]|uniref:Uncharacterized protein n=1 Tax=Nepenthes gracilis TaxID=150966 RepID=A0AAD3Y125_NEPGR|nr:hypothetical protein Nepgr_027235 [Nepenthes gracilis]